MFPLTLERNDYINALKAQFGQIRSAVDKSVFFTSRADSDESSDLFSLLEEYKILNSSIVVSLPDEEEPLNTVIPTGMYQIWGGATEFLVTGTGVVDYGSGYWLIPTGIEVTVTQNGAASVPSAETFVAIGDPTVFLISETEGTLNYIFPYHGKAWFGYLTVSGTDTVLKLALIKPDGTYHIEDLGNQIPRDTLLFFTHLFYDSDADMYFTGKELTYVADDYPTDAWVAPGFTYVPD